MAMSLPCKEGVSNASVFASATNKAEFAPLFAGREKLHDALFVDTHGHGRAPEMATRYVQWLDSMRVESNKRPRIWYMMGGMHAYCNAQCFGRVVMTTPNPFGEFPTRLIGQSVSHGNEC